MDKIFAKTLKTLLWNFLKLFKSSRFEVFFQKLGSNYSYIMIRNFMGKKKIEKTDDPEILHCRQMEK